MANVTIKDLSSIDSVTNDDLLVVWDDDGNTTKKVSASGFLNSNIDIPTVPDLSNLTGNINTNGSITGAGITDSNVTGDGNSISGLNTMINTTNTNLSDLTTRVETLEENSGSGGGGGETPLNINNFESIILPQEETLIGQFTLSGNIPVTSVGSQLVIQRQDISGFTDEVLAKYTVSSVYYNSTSVDWDINQDSGNYVVTINSAWTSGNTLDFYGKKNVISANGDSDFLTLEAGDGIKITSDLEFGYTEVSSFIPTLGTTGFTDVTVDDFSSINRTFDYILQTDFRILYNENDITSACTVTKDTTNNIFTITNTTTPFNVANALVIIECKDYSTPTEKKIIIENDLFTIMDVSVNVSSGYTTINAQYYFSATEANNYILINAYSRGVSSANASSNLQNNSTSIVKPYDNNNIYYLVFDSSPTMSYGSQPVRLIWAKTQITPFS